ncbi:MAG TPA: prepilin-type N-terminal cleavage/methylation domain-containing protein [Gemmatimonadaceae bacterium]|nr:prepilin-type N-terminal cleavage/methylation domain-containing protein [Gemmatimonadaceae bacterium]
MAATDRRRRGATLLEVVVALVILAVAGVALLALVGDTAQALDAQLGRDALGRRAAAAMEATALRTRPELIDLVGRRRADAVDLNVAQLAPALFEIAVTDTATGAVLLRTTLYRPEAPRDSTS